MVSTQTPSCCRVSETGYATACPDGERTTRTLSSRAKSTYSSAMITDTLLQPLERHRRLGRGVDLEHTLAVVAAARGLGDHRPAVLVAERDHGLGIGGHPVGGTGRTEGGHPVPHDDLVLGVDQRIRTGPYGHSGRLELDQQSGRHVLVVERDHVAASREPPNGVRIGVVTHGDVVDHGRRGDVRALGQQPDVDAERDGRLVQHPGELAAPDDADREPPHAGHAAEPYQRLDLSALQTAMTDSAADTSGARGRAADGDSAAEDLAHGLVQGGGRRNEPVARDQGVAREIVVGDPAGRHQHGDPAEAVP